MWLQAVGHSYDWNAVASCMQGSGADRKFPGASAASERLKVSAE